MALNQRMPTVDNSQFSMVPRMDVPRSSFITTHSRKSTFHTGYLVPIFVDEVLPGDAHRGDVTIFARLATPKFPVMDAMRLETFFFFVPNRLVWDNWKKMMGERANPSSSISFTVPRFTSAASGFAAHSLFDHMGLPTVGQVTAGQTVEVNALPIRMYNLIWNEWFRDQNLQDSLAVYTGDAVEFEGNGAYVMKRRNKKHDYFTSALPWPLKAGVEVGIPGAGLAPVSGIGFVTAAASTAGTPTANQTSPLTQALNWGGYFPGNNANVVFRANVGGVTNTSPMIYADLSLATGQTINALRLAFQTQRLLERDARSGTRYTELLRSHFGVTPEDTRLQRPEYIGGGRGTLDTQAIPQTSATGLTGGTSPLGALGAAATAADRHSFSYHATEHGFIIGLVHVTADITYQQGLPRMWTRSTRYDYYWPAFAHLGEQAIRYDEIYCTGNDVLDIGTFGYQERWAEYRHRQSQITGFFRSTTALTIDPWHLAQNFTGAPLLNSSFIEDNPPFARILTAGSAADNMQILFDSVFRIRSTRAMPMHSVPGMIDRF